MLIICINLILVKKKLICDPFLIKSFQPTMFKEEEKTHVKFEPPQRIFYSLYHIILHVMISSLKS